MIKWTLTLFIVIFILQSKASFVVSNNATIVDFGDSFQQSDAAGGMVTGYRFPDYLESYFQLNYPGSNINFINFSRSGQNMDGMLTNAIRYALPIWAYQQNNGQLIGIVQPTDNGSLTSNQMYLSMSNMFKFPGTMFDPTLTPQSISGWSATHTFQWLTTGDPPGAASDGGATGLQSVLGRNNASVNVANNLGALGIDAFNTLSNSWVPDWLNTSGANIQFVFPAGVEHFLAAGGLSWCFAFLRGFTTDTNISTCNLMWNGGVTSTNHCCVVSNVVTGGIMSFMKKDDRLPLAWDVPKGSITNDASTCFVLRPSDADQFRYTITITGMPAGSYNLKEGGTILGTYTDSQFASGINLMTNMYNGPTADQRREVLGRIRDKRHIDRTSLIPQSVNGHGEFSYFSDISSVSTLSGDALITSQLTNNVADIKSLNNLIQVAATPTNQLFTVEPVGASPAFTPSGFRL